MSRGFLPLLVMLAAGCAADYDAVSDAGAASECAPREGSRVVPALNYGRRYCFHVTEARPPEAFAGPTPIAQR